MRKLAAGAAAVACLLALTAGWSAAASQEADHLQAIAESAYIAGDYARAYRFFELAYEADPERIDNLHRQALCASHLGQYGKAEGLLRQVVLNPAARPDAHFDLAVALYMQSEYQEAYQELEAARAAGIESPSVEYYRGACLFYLGEYESALAPLDTAFAALPNQRDWLGYYLGGTEMSLEKYDAAIEHLGRAYAEAPPGEFRERIGRLLALAQEKRRRSKWWALRTHLGGAYDSNVFYEPEEFEIADRAGYYVYFDGDVALYPLRRDEGTLGVGYHFYQSLHRDDTEDGLLRDYDLATHAVRLEASIRALSGATPIVLGTVYEWTRAFLGGEHYQDANALFPNVTVSETHWTATRVGSYLEINRFPHEGARDAFYAAPSLSQIFTFWQGAGRVLVEGSYEHNDTDVDDFTYRGVGGYVALESPIYAPLYLQAGWRYRYLDYPKSDEERIDRKITVDAALEVWATNWLSVSGGYRFHNNVSLDAYSYEKHVFYTEIGLSF